MLMIPDYFHFLLTGRKAQEYTNATTSYPVDKSKTKDWDYQLIEKLGYPQDLFLEIKSPGYELGDLSNVIQKR